MSGSRYGVDDGSLRQILTELHGEYGFTHLIEGGAKGVDSQARQWAVDNSISVTTYHALWAKYGRFAGPRRNKTMLVKGRPDLVIAFQGGIGTINMIDQALREGVRVINVEAGDKQ